MKNKLLFLTILLSLFSLQFTHAQKYQSIGDRLEARLPEQKTAKDSIAILQQLVDIDPTNRNNEDYVQHLLKLKDRGKITDLNTYLLLQKVQEYTASKDFTKAIAIIQQVVSEFDKQHKVITWYLNALKDDYDAVGDQEARLKYFQQKLEYYQVNGPYENMGCCFLAIAGYYRYQAAYNQSINYYLKAAETFKRFNYKLYANQLIVVANEYIDWGNIDRASYYLHIAGPILDTFRFNELKLGYSYALGRMYLNSQRYVEAIKAYKYNISISVDPKTHLYIYARGSACCFSDEALAYIKLGQPELALPNLQKAQKIIDSGKYYNISVGRLGYLEFDYIYYKYYRLVGKNKRAEKSLLTACQIASKTNNRHFKLAYLKELAEFYDATNKPLKALSYYKEHAILLDTINIQQGKFKIAQYEVDQRDKLQQQHINELKQQKILQDYQLGRRNVLLWSSLVILFLILGLLAFIYRQLVIHKKTLTALKNTQLQLIQSAKMASLGELTAGIAHEIQNPLNFVNNFSGVNTELIEELQQEAENGNLEEIKELAAIIKTNEEKINHHGSRADFIVKGMLQHSRASTGERQITNINILADEFLKLSYHGLRAIDKSFNAELVTSFDEKLPKINIVQQDFGRVLVNLFNNAFYSINKKHKTALPSYKPEISLSTYIENGQVVIKIKDNGLGIPDDIKEKIMQPFFTTKPTGEGTGLGLSLSYDIVVKGHNGKITIDSQEGEYAEFKVFIPAV
jgi:two-component system NtrC family sensor kinase